MRRTLVFCLALLGLSPLLGFSAVGQAGAASIQALDRAGARTSQITDGNTLRLKVSLAVPVAQQAAVTFSLDGSSQAIASCTLAAGESSCTSEPFASLGWGWDAEGRRAESRVVRAYDVDGQLLAESPPLSVLARPVVLVHGFISSWETWRAYLGPDGYLASLGLQGFAVGDGQVAGALNTGSLADPTGRTNTIAQNAEIEGQYIAEVKKATGAEMVDLVVHSMGGMISRYYIDRVMKERDVAQLIMLGSPMGGSDCAVLPAALGFYLPASVEIRESYMKGIFNQQITHRRGVQFYDLGGTPIVEAFKSPCAEVPNDTVVSFGSINAIPLQAGRADALHSQLTSSRSVFEGFVRPLLQKPPGFFGFSADSAPTVASASALQFTRVYTGHVDRGGSSEVTIDIDPGVSVASFALYDSTRSLTVSVRGASGNAIQLDAGKNGLVKIDDPSSMYYLGYGFSNPRPGPWRVDVLATGGTPAGGADFAITAYFLGGATLQAQSSTLVPRVGETVEFTASLSRDGQPVRIDEARAVIRDAQGKLQTVEFDPSQHSAVWTATEPGTYGVDVVVAGQDTDGTPIERTAFLALEVQPNPSQARINTNLVLLVACLLAILGFIALVVVFGLRKLLRGRRGSSPA